MHISAVVMIGVTWDAVLMIGVTWDAVDDWGHMGCCLDD